MRHEERTSPRPISTGQLNALPRLHPPPIDLVVYKGPYSLGAMGELILRAASRLNFSQPRNHPAAHRRTAPFPQNAHRRAKGLIPAPAVRFPPKFP